MFSNDHVHNLFWLKGRAQNNLAKLLLAKALLLKHARTCFLLLKIWLAHTNRAKVLSSTFWHVQRAKCFLLKRVKTCSKAFLLFARLMCVSCIFNKRKHVLAKALLPKASLLDWSAPGLRQNVRKLYAHMFSRISFGHHNHLYHIRLVRMNVWVNGMWARSSLMFVLSWSWPGIELIILPKKALHILVWSERVSTWSKVNSLSRQVATL